MYLASRITYTVRQQRDVTASDVVDDPFGEKVKGGVIPGQRQIRS
jgi:hypothetical protein